MEFLYKELYKELAQGKNKCANEAELKSLWTRALTKILDVEFETERDYIDLRYNSVIIEFKSLGLFRGKVTSTDFDNAINDRLKPYIQKKAKAEGKDEKG